MSLQLISVRCGCCGDTLLVPWGIMKVGKIVEKVAVGVQMPWKECPTCGYSSDGVRFHAPDIGVKHQAPPTNHPGLKGLRK